MNFVIDLAHCGVYGSVVRASERGIQRSEVRFLMATQNFFLCPTLVTQGQKISSCVSLPSSKLTISLICIYITYSVWRIIS